MKRFVSRATACVALLLFVGGPLRAGLISSVDGVAGANATTSQNSSTPTTPVSFPGSHQVIATTVDGTTALAAVELFEQNGSTTISFGIDQQRSGVEGEGAFAESYFGVFFTADENAVFTASGDYQLTGTNYIVFSMSLTDLTTSTTLFQSEQRSDHTPQEQFVLGGTGGDLGGDIAAGSLQGSLIANHQYFLSGSASIQAFNFMDGYIGDSGATATGSVTLLLDPNQQPPPPPPPQPPSAAPEPASMALFSMGALGLIALRRREQWLAT